MANNMAAMIVGAIFVLIGGFITFQWREEFWIVFQGCLGVTLVFVGLLAIVIGFSEYRATKEFEAATASEPQPPAPAPSEAKGE